MVKNKEVSGSKSKRSYKTKTTAGEGEISILNNSGYYFLSHVFVMKNAGKYRLIVLRNNRVLKDCTYKTVRGAKIAFSKSYSKAGWEKGVKAEWGPFYNPDYQWLNEKLGRCNGKK